MLVQWVVSAAVLAPLLILAVRAGGPWFLALAAVASALANWEFYSLLQRSGYLPLWPFGLALSIAFIVDAYWLPGQIASPALALAVTLSLLYLVARQRTDRGLLDWALTWVPPLYAGFLLAFLVSLRLFPSGDRWIYLVLAVTWATDTAAYFTGRAVGRRRFFPRISPHKTLEGAAGGVVGGTLAGTLLAWYFGGDTPPFLAFAVVASVAAVAGDLAESLMKRQLQTKDASRLIPGHGGILDRMDSMLFVGVVAHFWALWVGGNL